VNLLTVCNLGFWTVSDHFQRQQETQSKGMRPNHRPQHRRSNAGEVDLCDASEEHTVGGNAGKLLLLSLLK